MVLKENTSHGVRRAGVCEHSKTVIDGDDHACERVVMQIHLERRRRNALRHCHDESCRCRETHTRWYKALAKSGCSQKIHVKGPILARIAVQPLQRHST